VTRVAQTLRRDSAPTNFHNIVQIVFGDVIQTDQNRRIAAIMISRVKRTGVCLDAKVTFDIATFYDECRVVVTQASEEFPAHPKASAPVARSLFNSWKLQ
jgi:hypothetical protein